MPQGPVMPVDLTHAAEETKRWREFMQVLAGGNPGNIINGYYIPREDINAILQYAPGGLRTYFALRDGAGGAGQNIHIYVVPLDENGDDILTDAAGNSLIYDSTMPCPNMCGSGNPLNGGA